MASMIVRMLLMKGLHVNSLHVKSIMVVVTITVTPLLQVGLTLFRNFSLNTLSGKNKPGFILAREKCHFAEKFLTTLLKSD